MRLSTSTNPLRKVSSFGYTFRGMLAWSKAPGESDALRTGYAYDAMDRVTSVSKAVPGLPVSVSNSYTYEHDRIKTLTHSNTAEASTTYTFNYGAFGLPSSILVGQRTLISNTYDTAGRTFNLLNAAYGLFLRQP